MTPTERRLSDVWRSWSIKQADGETKAQRAGLDPLADYLRTGPTAFMRCMQALCVDPERPGASKRPLFGELWPVVEAEWASAGTEDRDVVLLQAMLVAVEWPATVANEALGTCALSPWLAMQGRERQRAQLVRWRDERAKESTGEDADEADADESSQQCRSGDTLEYLWWGQARYCQLARRPYRRITERSTQIWLAALEASQHATTLQVEPSAAYLQEVLHGLGLPLDERQPLHAHVASLQKTLLAGTNASLELPPSLARLVDHDALGLPVCLLIRKPSTPDSQLHDMLGIAADTEIDLGEWIAWQFRELVLVRRWPEPV